MAFKVQARLEGLRPLLARLQAVEKAPRKKILRSAATAGGQVVLEAARAKVPIGVTTDSPGLTRKSLGKLIKIYGGTAVAIVGPRTGFSRPRKGPKRLTALGKKYKQLGRNPAYTAHLVEGGVRPHQLGKGSSLRKRIQRGGAGHPGVPARPFIRPSLENNVGAVEAAMGQIIVAGLEEAWGV